MTSYTSSIPAIDEGFTAQWEDIYLHARDLVGNHVVLDTTMPREVQFDTLRRYLTDFVNSAETSSDRRMEGYQLMMLLQRTHHASLENALDRQLTALSDIRGNINELSGLSPHELIDTVPAQMCRSLSMGRAMISAVRGSTWLPRNLFIEERTPDSAAFEAFVHGARISLSDAPLETEMLVRRRTAALVPDPVADRRTYKEIVDAAQTRGYLAAPITLRSRTIGMLHADRPQDPNSLSDDDLELLGAFAECLSIVFESAFLQQRVARQVECATETYARVVSMVGDSGTPQWTVQRPVPPRGLAGYPHPAVAGRTALTLREREVLDQLATGATNMQIARNLVVSEATIKSHLKQISKKLGTSSRAESVAVYARMAERPYGIAR